METNKNSNSTTPNLWDTVKAVLTGKYIAIQAYLRKEEQSQMNSLNSQLMKLEKEQMRPNVSRRRNIIKIREEINKMEKIKTIERINENRSWFFEKINKINKLLARLIKKKRESTHINRIRNEKGKSLWIPQKYKELLENTMKNSMLTNRIT